MYGKALLDGAEIYENTGRPGTAEEYRERQKHITDRIQALCWDEGRNMYREGPSYPEFTQHAQSWAVLNGMISGREALCLPSSGTAETKRGIERPPQVLGDE